MNELPYIEEHVRTPEEEATEKDLLGWPYRWLRTIDTCGLDTITFWEANRLRHENLHLVDIPKSSLYYGNIEAPYKGILDYFEIGIFVEDIAALRKVHHYSHQFYFDNYLRLADTFEKTYYVGKRPEAPVSVYWNGDANHGFGGIVSYDFMRVNLHNFFDKGPLRCLYFNTGGAWGAFMNEAQVFDMATLGPDYEIKLHSSNMSIVPHIVRKENAQKIVETMHARLRERFVINKERVSTNTMPIASGGWMFNPTGRYVLEWKTTPDKRNIMKAFLVLATETPQFENAVFKITTR